MADALEPNDLSHMTGTKFNALCSQGEHALGPEPLSPVAQTAINAAGRRYAIDGSLQDSIAAALRAAADQVVPDGPKPSGDSDYHLMNWTKSLDQYYQRQQTREELLALAAELDGHHA